MKGIAVCKDCEDLSILQRNGGESMKSQYLILGVVVAVALGEGFFFLNNTTAPSPVNNEVLETQEKPATEETTKNTDAPALSDRYLDYSSDNLAKATENNSKAVIFFAALKWCPSCQSADRDLKENFSKVPTNVTIMKVDYDTATELKQKYAITMQDTFVQIDASGKEITRWNSGGQGVKALLANAK